MSSDVNYKTCSGCGKPKKTRSNRVLQHNRWNGKEMVLCSGSFKPPKKVTAVTYLKGGLT